MALEFLQRYILIHLNDPYDKVRLFSLMTRKLVLLKAGLVRPENLDSLMV